MTDYRGVPRIEVTKACPSNSEAFSAAAKALDVGVVVLETFVEAVPREVDPSSILRSNLITIGRFMPLPAYGLWRYSK